jgi:hypothetical protein
MVILGFLQFVLVDIYFRLQQITLVSKYFAGSTSPIFFPDGILYQPLVLSMLIYSVLLASSVLLVNSGSKGSANLELTLLGSAWILASVPLSFDFLVDSFELKIPMAVFFVYSGLRYWKGVRNNSLGFVLAPLVAAIAAVDGIGHVAGSFCQQSGLDSCSAKAVSDTYLVIMLLALMYFTVRGRDERPNPLLILATLLFPIVILAGLVFVP